MSRNETPLRARQILEALDGHGVDYLLIGGLAVQAHGHPRTTQGLDLVPAPDPQNLDCLATSVRGLGATPPDLSGAGPFSVDTEAGRIDIHLVPPGAAPYAELRRRAMELDLFGLRIAVVGKDDLIAMKRASGRPLDRGDVVALTSGEAG